MIINWYDQKKRGSRVQYIFWEKGNSKEQYTYYEYEVSFTQINIQEATIAKIINLV